MRVRKNLILTERRLGAEAASRGAAAPFTPSTRVVSRNNGSGWFFFEFDRSTATTRRLAQDDSDDVPDSATLARKKSAGSAKKSPRASPLPGRRLLLVLAQEAKGWGSGAGLLRHATRQAPQEFLRRWWYAYDWPSQAAIDKEPEAGFESLVAFRRPHLHAGRRRALRQGPGPPGPCSITVLPELLQETVRGAEALCLKAFEVQMAQLLKGGAGQRALHQQTEKGAA